LLPSCLLKIANRKPCLTTRRCDTRNPLVNLLPYHNIASGKYKKLEMFYDSTAMDEPTSEDLKTAAEIFEKYGIEVEVGG
jgi:pyruvate formate lyase activating enzyme